MKFKHQKLIFTEMFLSANCRRPSHDFKQCTLCSLTWRKTKFLKYGKCFKARQHLVFTMNVFGIVIKRDFTKRMLKSYPRRDCIRSLLENVHKQENIFFSFSDICIICIFRQTFLQRLFFFFSQITWNTQSFLEKSLQSLWIHKAGGTIVSPVGTICMGAMKRN